MILVYVDSHWAKASGCVGFVFRLSKTPTADHSWLFLLLVCLLPKETWTRQEHRLIQSLLRNSCKKSNKASDEVLFQQKPSKGFIRELPPALLTTELPPSCRQLCARWRRETLTCPGGNGGLERYKCNFSEVFP